MKNCIITAADNFLSKAIVFNLYLFALGLFTSKALTSISGVLICFIGLLQMVIMVIIKENPLIRVTDKSLNLPILFFTFALIMAVIEHPDSEAFSQIQKHLLLFLFFFITVSNLNNLKQVKKSILIATISMSIAAVYGFYQHYPQKITRIGSFSFPLAFGCLLAIFIVFLLVYVFWGKINTGLRISLLTGVTFLGLNLLLTQARGAWLALLGGIFTLAWLKSKKVLVILLIIGLISYLFLPQMYLDRFKSSFDVKQDHSNLTRIALWKSAISMYRDHPINGVGLGRFSEEYETNYNQPYPVSTTCHAHNNILQFMAEAGTLGLVGFIWLMVAIVIWLYKNYQRMTNHNWRLFLLASLCGVIVFNIQGLTEVNYGDAETLRFFWFLIAINAAIIKLIKNDATQPE
ncbi:MAG: O-antigen ligase family protein [Bacteroidota bacterium]